MKRSSILIFISAIFMALFLFFIPNETSARADTAPTSSIEIGGLTAADATIKDVNGNIVPPGQTLYDYENYDVTYAWTIPDGVKINTGDIATFEIPSNIKIKSNLSIPMYNHDGIQIGTFNLVAGRSTGRIIFNDALANTSTDRHGMLFFHALGATASDNTNNHFDWNINKFGWYSNLDEYGTPRECTWNIALNPQGAKLTNVVVTDTLGPGQTYIPNSVLAPTGKYDSSGTFIADGNRVIPKVTVDGNKVIFDFGSINSTVNMTFRTKIDPDVNGNNKWTDDAVLTSDTVGGNSSASITWGGSGTGTGTSHGDVVLTKHDAITQVLLPGAYYELRDSTGKIVQERLVTNEFGFLRIPNLVPGTYSLTETQAPEGYELNPNPINFTVESGEDSNVDLTQDDFPLASKIIFTKTDQTGTYPLANAVYKLVDADGNVVKENLTTDAQGQLTLDGLAEGQYSLIETKAPEGYELNQTPVTFTISNAVQKAQELNQKDTPLPDDDSEFGNLVFTKTDSVTKGLVPGATYDLINARGEVLIKGLVTNEDGQFLVKDLYPETYTLIETKAPEGYELNSKPIKFTITVNQTEDVTQEDTKLPEDENDFGGFKLTKIDAKTNGLLAGAVYKLLDANGKIVLESLTTDQNGQIQIDSLLAGSYTLIETKAPDGYELNSAPIKFEIKKDETTDLQQEDTEIPSEENNFGGFVLTKTDDKGDLLAGAHYDLLDAKSNIIAKNLVTDENGQIKFENLPAGTYQLVETQAPEVYLLDQTPIEFEVKADTIEDVKQLDVKKPSEPEVPTKDTGGFILFKTNVKEKFLAGAHYDLLDKDGNIVIKDLVTDQNGQIKLGNLPVGSYQLIETQAPEGYRLNDIPMEFEIKANTIEELEQLDVKLPSNPKPPEDSTGSFILTKQDATTKEALAGATYNLLDSQGNVVREDLTTGLSGEISLDGLLPGKYSLVETKAPNGYQMNKEPIVFEVKDGDNTTLTQTDIKKPTTPTNPEKPSKPENPTPPTKPVEPEKPTVPGKPIKPEKPTVPSKPENPTPPTKPVEPEKPTVPGEPIKPEKPTVPSKPEKPVVPTEPSIPAPPVTPSEVLPSTPNPSVPNPGGPTTGTGSAVPNTNSSSSNQNGSNKLPQTGNNKEVSIIGLSILLFLLVLLRFIVKKS